MVALNDADAVCSAATLSKVLGVTDQRVRQLDKEGVLRCVRSEHKGKHYRLSKSVQRYLRYQREYVTEQVKGTDEAYTSARARRMAAVAEQAELDLQVKKGRLHRQDDLEFWLGLLLGSTRDKLLGVPNKVMHSLLGLSSPAEANRIVAEAIELALTDLSKANVSDFNKESEAFLLAQESGANGQTADGTEPD